MHLIEILLPLCDDHGIRFAPEKLETVRDLLTKQFGGVTAFTRTPAEGFNASAGEIQHDDIVVLEVMTDALDREWWAHYRKTLELAFSQEEIVIRETRISRL